MDDTLEGLLQDVIKLKRDLANIITPEISLYPFICDGRLTLTSNTPVTTSNVTGATTLYYTPYKGNQVAIYNSSQWITYTFSQLSLSLSGFTAGKNNDVFIYNNNGVLTLERVEWTNDTTRATAITVQDGVIVKSGDVTRRYLGTFRTTASTGQCEDSLTNRYVWNYYNRVHRPLTVRETTSHTYNTATWRPWNNVQSAADVEFVIGVIEDRLFMDLRVILIRISTDGIPLAGIGLNITNNASSLSYLGSQVVGNVYVGAADSSLYPRLGYNFLCCVEFSTVGATAATFNELNLTAGLRG